MGRKYITTASDRRKKRSHAPNFNFSSDDDSEVPAPIPKKSTPAKVTKNPEITANTPKGQVNKIIGKKTTVNMNQPRAAQAWGNSVNMQTETDDFCGQCSKIFGREEIMVCANCSDSFCCPCARVPEAVADVQFNVSNLKWYCLPCDKIVSTVMTDYRNGVLIKAPVELEENNEGSANVHDIVEETAPRSEAITDPVLKNLLERMNGFETIVNDIKNMLHTRHESDSTEKARKKGGKNVAHTERQSQVIKPPMVMSRPTAQENQEVPPLINLPYANAVKRNLSAQPNNQKRVNPDSQQQNFNMQSSGNNLNNAPQQVIEIQSRESEGRRKPRLRPSAVNSEVSEREKRKNNIVIHNMAEPQSGITDPQKKKDADIQEVNFMLREGMQIKNTMATEATRLGALRVDGRPRSLLVTLNGDRELVIRKQSTARQYEDWEKVVIQPDRTLKQRAEYEALRKELKARKENGEQNLYIKDGQICQRSRLATWEPFPSIQEADNADLAQPIIPLNNQEESAGNEQEDEHEATGASVSSPSTAPEHSNQETVEATAHDEGFSLSQGIPAVSDKTLGELVIEIPRSTPDQPERDAPPAGPSCTLY